MKKVILILIAFSFLSCKEQVKEKSKYSNRNFVVTKTDDNNWTTSAVIYCDSVDMLSINHAIYWIDGSNYNLYAKSSIKVFSNK